MLPSIAKLASKHGIRPLKKYGQNFIFDATLCDKIVGLAGVNISSNVLEIGPGPAGLTRSILKAGPKSLSVIETDSRCLPLLHEIKENYSSLRIIHNDALKIKLSDITKDLISGNNKLDIISNLPYNIGTKLLISWLYQITCVNSMVLMLQKEVVDRIISKEGCKTYGRLSIICQLMFDVEKCFDVSPKAFYPEPKIWSSIVRLIPKKQSPGIKTLARIEKITMEAFSSRRKMIKSSLQKTSSDIDNILNSLEIDPSLRAENLSPNDYWEIAKRFD